MPTLSRHDRRQVLEPLAVEDSDAIVACFASGGEDPSALQVDRARRTLNELRDRRLWLACDCQAPNVPTLAPAKIGDTLYVRRCGEHAHAEDCPLFVLREPPTEQPAEQGTRKRQRWDGDWLFLDESATRVARLPSPAKESARRSAPGLPTLARALYATLEDLGFYRLSTATPADANPYEALASLGKNEVLEGLTWNEVGTTMLKGTPRVLARLPQQTARFGRERPQGYFFGIVSGVEHGPEGDVVVGGNAEDLVRVPIGRAWKQFGNATGPFWLCMVAGQAAGAERFTWLRAYAHPVLSRRVLLPVDSGLERETAKLLLKAMRAQVAIGAVPELTLVKPVSDEDTPTGPCRPDFEVRLPNGRKILVECMGRDKDPEYLASKALTHPRMLSLPGVVELLEFRPGEDDDAAFAKRLGALVRANR